jgi:hypothetical protein
MIWNQRHLMMVLREYEAASAGKAAVIAAVLVWGAAITGFGLVRWLPPRSRCWPSPDAPASSRQCSEPRSSSSPRQTRHGRLTGPQMASSAAWPASPAL